MGKIKESEIFVEIREKRIRKLRVCLCQIIKTERNV